jgi:hypothetical protein
MHTAAADPAEMAAGLLTPKPDMAPAANELHVAAAFLAAFAFDVDDCGAVGGGVDVAHIGLPKLVRAQAASSAVGISARSRSAQSVWRFDSRSCAAVSSRCFDREAGEGLGEGLWRAWVFPPTSSNSSTRACLAGPDAAGHLASGTSSPGWRSRPIGHGASSSPRSGHFWTSVQRLPTPAPPISHKEAAQLYDMPWLKELMPWLKELPEWITPTNY